MVSAGTWMFLCSVVWFLVTVTVGLAHSSAALAMMCSTSKSFERMRTEPLSMPQSAEASAVEASRAPTAIEGVVRYFMRISCCGGGEAGNSDGPVTH